MKYKNYKARVKLNGLLTTVKTRAENQFEAKRILEAQYGKIAIVQDDYEANRAEESAQQQATRIAHNSADIAGDKERNSSEGLSWSSALRAVTGADAPSGGTSVAAKILRGFVDGLTK